MAGSLPHDFIDDIVVKHVPERAYAEQWDVAGLKEELKRVLDVDLPVEEWAKEEGIADEGLPPTSKLFAAVIDDYIGYRERDLRRGKTSAGMPRQIIRVSKF